MDPSWFYLYCLFCLLASSLDPHGKFWMNATQYILEKKIVESLDAVVFLLELFIYLPAGTDHPKAIQNKYGSKCALTF